MADTINISCPSCKTLFEVPVEMIGQTVECSECGNAFEIVPPNNTPGETTTVTNPSVNVSDKNSTQTVKISRAGIGMVPDIEDNYQVDVVDQHVEKTELRKSFESGEYAVIQDHDGESPETAKTPAEPDKKWWKFWKK
ncbi:MAG: hypothetical protein PHQ27_02775 [Victivallales bacterium]|nr:hypothetical protein [Victivallales bacterium]